MFGAFEAAYLVGTIISGLFLMRSGVGDTYAGSVIGAIMTAFWPVTLALGLIVIWERDKHTNKS